MSESGGKTVADAVRLADGSVIDFSQIDPPDSGTVLYVGGNDDIGFEDPVDIATTEGEVKEEPPMPPSGVHVHQSLGVISGESPNLTIQLHWVPPTTNLDGTDLIDLRKYRIYSTPAGGTPQLVAEQTSDALEEFYLTYQPLGTNMEYGVSAVDSADYESTLGIVAVTTQSDTATPDITGLALSVKSNGVLSATWDALSKANLWGFKIEIAESANNTWTSPTWVPVGDLMIAAGRKPYWQMTYGTAGNWYKIRVKAFSYGGGVSANWVTSSSVQMMGLVASDFDTGLLNAEIDQIVGGGGVVLNGTGMVIKNGKFLFTSDDGSSSTPSAALRIGMQGAGITTLINQPVGGTASLINSVNIARAQTFVAPVSGRVNFSFPLRRDSGTSLVVCELRPVVDVGGILSPSGTVLASVTAAVTSSAFTWIPFSIPYDLVSGTTYAISLRCSTSTDVVATDVSASSQYAGGMRWVYTTGWAYVTGSDLAFSIFQNISATPQVAAFNSGGQKALLGQSGTFWGLYVEGGAIQIKTAGDSVTIDSAGILGNMGGVDRFKLNAAGLTLDGADIFIDNGGHLTLAAGGSGATEHELKLSVDPTYGASIRAMLDGEVRLRITEAGIIAGYVQGAIVRTGAENELRVQMDNTGANGSSIDFYTMQAYSVLWDGTPLNVVESAPGGISPNAGVDEGYGGMSELVIMSPEQTLGALVGDRSAIILRGDSFTDYAGGSGGGLLGLASIDLVAKTGQVSVGATPGEGNDNVLRVTGLSDLLYITDDHAGISGMDIAVTYLTMESTWDAYLYPSNLYLGACNGVAGGGSTYIRGQMVGATTIGNVSLRLNGLGGNSPRLEVYTNGGWKQLYHA